MHFEQPMHRGGQRGGGPPRGGLLGEFPRGGFRGGRPRMPPDCPPNFRGRGPMFNAPRGMGMHGPPGPPRGPPGPNFGGGFPIGGRFGPPRMPPGGMPGNGPRPMFGPPFGMPPPEFEEGGENFQQREPQEFGDPPNANIPGLDLTGEIWVETKAGEGKCYYYNARTRETSWTKPENVKILNQEQIEAMANAAGANNEPPPSENENGVQANPQENPPNPQFPFIPMGGVPAPGMGMMPPPPFGMMPPPFAMPPPRMMGAPPFGMPPMPFRMPGMPIPGQMPPVAPGEAGANEENAESAGEKTDGPEKKSAPPKEVEWAEFISPDGKSYYYNKVTQLSVWEKPQALIDAENCAKEHNEPEGAPGVETKDPEAFKAMDTTQETTDGSSLHVNGTDVDGEMIVDESSHMKEEKKGQPVEQVIPQQPVDKSRPVSSTPIPGTPWCVVRTGDNRVFFFNPSSRNSVWEKPEELKGIAAVDELLQIAPEQSPTKKEPTQPQRDASPEPKKMKLEEPTANAVGNETPQPPENKNNINPGKESAIEAELRAAKERANIPLDVRTKQFREMLAEKGVSAFSNWEKELHKIVFDSRYLLLTSKERKQVFEKYVRERAEEERNERRKKIQQRKDDYMRLLDEATLTATSTFSDFVDRFGKDDRFKKIEKMRERQNMFNSYLHDLRKKEKDERSSQREKIRKDFIELLKENKDKFDKHSKWKEVKKNVSDDARYKAVESSSLREELFKDYLKKASHSGDDDTSKEREKQKRAEASIREREKEVQRTLSTHLREAEKERELHKHEEALQHFKALLADLVRTPDITWHDAKKTLRKDHRWKTVESLERDERERVFEEHITALNRKKREKFRELLDETSSITLTSSWKDVKELIKEDARYTKFSSSDRKCEKEFKEYLKDKMIAAKADFRELLSETKIITYKSRKMMEDSDHLKDVEKVLENDKRYLVLQCISDERWELLMSYIDALEKKGPPPPPTASEPSRRPFPK